MAEPNTSAIDQSLRSGIATIVASMPTLIQDRVDAERVSQQQVVLRQYDRRIAEFFAPLKADVHRAHKALTTREKTLRDEIKRAIKEADSRMAVYLREEQARQEAERRKQAEADAALTRDLRESLEQEAIDRGDVDLLDEAELIVPMESDSRAPVALRDVAPPSMIPVEKHTPVVVDLLALLRAVVAGTVPRDIIRVDDAALRKHAKAHQYVLDWPGVEMSTDVGFRMRRTE